MTTRACLVVFASLALSACGYKGPLVAADPAAPGDAKTPATSRAPDAESAALPASRDADAVIDETEGDPSEADPGTP